MAEPDFTRMPRAVMAAMAQAYASGTRARAQGEPAATNKRSRHMPVRQHVHGEGEYEYEDEIQQPSKAGMQKRRHRLQGMHSVRAGVLHCDSCCKAYVCSSTSSILPTCTRGTYLQ
jgi:hypothetical protein